MPGSWSKKKQAAALCGEIFPTGRPDLDNLIKAVKDCCNGVIWLDDSRVVAEAVSKFYGDAPRVEIEIWEVEG